MPDENENHVDSNPEPDDDLRQPVYYNRPIKSDREVLESDIQISESEAPSEEDHSEGED